MSATVAIVLARAGSKGVPNKNVADVAGRPCVAWTIEHALNTPELNGVVVSSDSPRVLTVARGMGAVAHDRDTSLATDHTPVDDAARSAVEYWVSLADAETTDDDAYIILYGNVPVRPHDLTSRAIEVLRNTGCDSVQSYAPVGKHHPWWTARLDTDGRVDPWEGDVLNHGVFRRQDLPPAFIPNGGVLVVTRRALFGRIEDVRPGAHAFLGHDRRGINTDEGDVVDIDSELDLIVANAILRSQAAPPLAKPA